MEYEKTRIRVQADFSTFDNFKLYILHYDPYDKKLKYLKGDLSECPNAKWESSINHSTEPLLGFGPDAAQNLMNDLWNAGVRPKEIGTVGHLQATERHLNDMRVIVEKNLDIKLP